MNIISRRIISMHPLKDVILEAVYKKKEPDTIINRDEKELQYIGPKNYSPTPALAIYTTSREMHNKGRVILVKRRE